MLIRKLVKCKNCKYNPKNHHIILKLFSISDNFCEKCISNEEHINTILNKNIKLKKGLDIKSKHIYKMNRKVKRMENMCKESQKKSDIISGLKRSNNKSKKKLIESEAEVRLLSKRLLFENEKRKFLERRMAGRPSTYLRTTRKMRSGIVKLDELFDDTKKALEDYQKFKKELYEVQILRRKKNGNE